jgi:Gluconate 2-dehydrogenase subunit 3
MNRRSAILRISIATLGAITAGATYKWWTLARRPDLDYLRQNPQLIAALAETIIPATGSPGAKAAGVQDFILKMITNCTPRKEQNSFIDGLKDLQTWCRHTYSLPFEECPANQQQATLARFEEKDKPYKGNAGKLESRLLGRPFFTILKDYTVQGYCTSQPGATQGLAYAYIPGHFSACIPLQPDQKAWATN